MDNNIQKLVEQLRQMNEMNMNNVIQDFQQRRRSAKLNENLKKSHAESLEALKKQFAQEPTSTNTFLSDLLGKLTK